MLPGLALLDDLAESDYRPLLDILSGIDAAQLDWKPHPAANSVRWIVGHRYQVRYIRGAYSRAHGASKVVFDPR